MGVSFHCMGQSIHAGGGGGVGRQPLSQLRIQHSVLGNQEGVVDGSLAVGCGVGNDRGNGGFRTGAGSGGDGNKSGDGPVDLQKALKLADLLAGVDCLGSNTLGTVDTAAAAQRYNGLASVFFKGFVAGFHIVGSGVSGVVGLQGVADAICFKAVQHGLDLTTAHHAGTGDDKYIVQLLFF